MLLRAYGTFWNPDVVDWGRPGRGNRGSLSGGARVNGRDVSIDFWEAKGLYVLYDNLELPRFR